MINQHVRLFMAGLSITLIVIGLGAGLLMVDLSSERYMPGLLPPVYMVDGIDTHGLNFYWMGERYLIDTAYLQEIQTRIWHMRAFIPPGVRLAGGIVAAIMS